MVMSKLKKAAVALAFLSTFGAANATPYDFGTLNATVGKANIQVAGSFDDQFTFTAGSQPGVLGGVLAIDVLGDLSASYRFGVGATPVWTSFASLVTPGPFGTRVLTFSETVGSLTAGTQYWVNVKGSATAAAYSVTLAPVPEPETYAMLLAGLGLIGTIARRRRVATAA
jgi:hypothetical protein